MTDGAHAMRGCEPCQGRKAAAISIVSCVPWEFLPRAFYDLRHTAPGLSRRFLCLSASCFERFMREHQANRRTANTSPGKEPGEQNFTESRVSPPHMLRLGDFIFFGFRTRRRPSPGLIPFVTQLLQGAGRFSKFFIAEVLEKWREMV